MQLSSREAKPDDDPAIAKLHVTTFNETHRDARGGGPSYELREQQWRQASTVIDRIRFCCVAQKEDGELIGFAKGTPHDGAVPGFGGELNKIYALRRFHRQGVGRRLLCSVAQRFLEAGVDSMLLFGEATSPSNGFQEAFGAERLFSSKGEFHGGYGWRDLRSMVTKCGTAWRRGSSKLFDTRMRPRTTGQAESDGAGATAALSPPGQRSGFSDKLSWCPEHSSEGPAPERMRTT